MALGGGEDPRRRGVLRGLALEVGLVEPRDRVANVGGIVDRQVALAVAVDVGEGAVPQAVAFGGVELGHRDSSSFGLAPMVPPGTWTPPRSATGAAFMSIANAGRRLAMCQAATATLAGAPTSFQPDVQAPPSAMLTAMLRNAMPLELARAGERPDVDRVEADRLDEREDRALGVCVVAGDEAVELDATR